MAGQITEAGSKYSSGVGLVYVFNLIVGTGALTMPLAFQEAGWLLSLVIVVVLAFTSFLTVTFMIECMAVSNAVLRSRIQQDGRVPPRGSINQEDEEIEDIRDLERKPLLNGELHNVQILPENEGPDVFEITHRVELGQMATLFFNRIGLNLFYLCIAIYLYGDLAIYGAAVPKSIRDVACTFSFNGSDCNKTLTDSDLCWPDSSITRSDAYRIFVACFVLLLGPFTFFNIQKTMYLQIFTSLSRWVAFIMMIVLTAIRLANGQGQGHPVVADVSGVPNLFGVCVYSFMCHHSLPSLITPIKNKKKIVTLLASDYILILIFYAILSFTGIFAFSSVKDVYTLNFLPPSSCNDVGAITDSKFIQYFLALFPVFTLSTNFPIISITLRNNLKTVCHNEHRPYPWIVDRIVFPLLALLPPMAVAMGTDQVEFLVGITGSYAGAGIQYVIPAALVFFARKQYANFEGTNTHKSPFFHTIWVICIVVWAGLCIVFVTVNHIVTGK